MDEKELISALKNGEASAFGQLVNMYQHMVYNTTLGLLQHETDAEDVAQEVFMTVFQSIKGFKGESKLSTWLYRIAISKSLEWIRKKNRKKRFAFMQSIDTKRDDEPAMEIPHFHHPGVQLENKERAAILFAAIAQLPEQQKTAFILFQAEQLSHADIAAAMETTIPSVESLLFRARKKLRTLLAHYYDTHER